jgi:hypothetical protein
MVLPVAVRPMVVGVPVLALVYRLSWIVLSYFSFYYLGAALVGVFIYLRSYFAANSYC